MATINLRDFPDDLHYRASVAAARQRESLKSLTIRAIRREVERIEATDQTGDQP